MLVAFFGKLRGCRFSYLAELLNCRIILKDTVSHHSGSDIVKVDALQIQKVLTTENEDGSEFGFIVENY